MGYLYWWEQVEDGIYGEFGHPEMGWLRHSLAGYHRMLETRVAQYRYYDPLCDLLDMPLPTTALQSESLSALQREVYGPATDEVLQRWQEAELVTGLKHDAEIMRASLPASGKSVQLQTELDVHAWYWVLVNMRFVYGIIRGKVDLAYAPEGDQPEIDPNSRDDRDRYLMWWLGCTAATLRDVSGEPLPEIVLH